LSGFSEELQIAANGSFRDRHSHSQVLGVDVPFLEDLGEDSFATLL
jgi:hypothetical protein